MLAESGPQEWLYKELSLINKVNFDFKNKEEAEDYASSLSYSGQNQYVTPQHTLSHSSLLREYDADLISKCLRYLNPNNYRLFIGAQEHKAVECKLEEKYYGIQYNIADPPSHLKSNVKYSSSLSKQLYLPDRNAFLPDNLSVTKPDTPANPPAVEPVLLRKNGHIEVWFKKDDQFFTPHGRIGLTINSEVPAFDQDMLEEALKDVTLNGLQAHIESVLGKAYVKMLVSGNYEQSVALNTSSQVLDILQHRPAPRYLINAHRSPDIEPGYYVQNVPIGDQKGLNSAVGESNPAYVTQRINQFIREYRLRLIELSTEEFESSVQSLISLKQEKLLSMDDEFSRLWVHISSDEYMFDTLDKEVEQLKQLSKDNLLEFWDKYINKDTAKHYTRLDMQMWSTKIWQPTPEEFEMYP
ncbi:metalloprotease, partial [Coemansia sp. RSA 2671]